MRFLIPFSIFVVVTAFLAAGLTRDPRLVPSPLIAQPAPSFELPQLHDATRRLSDRDLRGQPTIVNVFASWCLPCREEHPLLTTLAGSGGVRLVGLNYKDRPDDARRWLAELGDPYHDIGSDQDGQASIDWGVYGVPETFVLDAEGIIRFKHVGPLTQAILRDTVIPLLDELGRARDVE